VILVPGEDSNAWNVTGGPHGSPAMIFSYQAAADSTGSINVGLSASAFELLTRVRHRPALQVIVRRWLQHISSRLPTQPRRELRFRQQHWHPIVHSCILSPRFLPRSPLVLGNVLFLRYWSLSERCGPF
jgi:hypothetical protein